MIAHYDMQGAGKGLMIESFFAGIAQGGALEYLRTMNERDDALRTRRIDTIYDVRPLYHAKLRISKMFTADIIDGFP